MTPDLPDRDTLARMFHRDVSKCPCGEPDPLDYIYADAVLAAGWRPPTPATDRLRAEQDAVHADLIAILTALGIGAHARPYSGHEVVQREVLPAIRRLTETRLCDCPPTPATDGLREALFYTAPNGDEVFRFADPRIVAGEDPYIGKLIPAIQAALAATDQPGDAR